MPIRNPYEDLGVFMTRHSLLASLQMFAGKDPTREIEQLLDLTGLVITLGVGGRQ